METDDSSDEEEEPKKASRSGNEKKAATKRPHSLKKDQKPQGPLIQVWMTQVPKMNKNLQ